jgi:RNA polymerase sigma factor (sigma-70 family)
MIVSWRRLRDVENIDAYVHRSIVNASRRSWRRTAAETLVAEPPDELVVDHADRYAEHDEVAAALRDLPPRQRAAVVLRFYLDLSEAATAQALGCSVGAVKSQTSRGLAKLRERLAATQAEPGPGAERRLG